MKKNLFKYLLLFSAFVFLSPLVACGNSSSESVNPNHQFIESETDEYLVKDGVTKYKIVMPSENGSEYNNAKDELLRFFEEATDIKLNVINDNNLLHHASQHYISLGDTSLLKSAGLYDPNINLKTSGTRVVTVDNNIYIFGENGEGVLYGVYDLLSSYFNFEYYYVDAYTLNTGVKDLKFKKMNYTDIPDIEFRQRRGLFFPTSGDNDDVMFAYRCRTTDDMNKLLLPIYQGSDAKNVHNSFFFIPKTTDNLAKHPNWFATSGEQLCYTARKIGSEEYKAMVHACALKVIESLKINKLSKTIRAVGIFIEDNSYYCQCEECKRVVAEHNNAPVAPIIIFVKAMGREVNEWMAQPENAEYARDLSYMFFAYQGCLQTPFESLDNVKKDVSNEPDVKIMPYVALSDFDITRPLEDKSNEQLRHLAELWGAYYPGAWAWSYGAFFNDYMAFFDCYSFYRDYNKFITANKYSVTFNQVQDDQRGAHTGFYNMASYALAKLSWNSSLDIFELCDNYLRAVFKEAYAPMNELFNRFRLMFADWMLTFNFGKSANGEIVTTNAKYYSTGLLRQFLALLDQAYEKIAIYKDMPEEYARLSNYIDLEWLFIGKVIIDCGETLKGFTKQEIADAKAKFIEIVERNGIRDYREFRPMSEYINSIM